MGPDSVFSLGSITKPFTAAALLRLQELGKLKTTDPISRFFEGVPRDKAAITLEHLLTHSSGLESDFSPTDYEPTAELLRFVDQGVMIFLASTVAEMKATRVVPHSSSTSTIRFAATASST